MITANTLTVFIIASLALALAPGPDNIFVLTQSALNGRRAGFWITLGLCTGLVGHTLAVALGVAALVLASSLAFTLLKIAGAAYLSYLAIQAFRAGSSTLDGASGERMPWHRLFVRGIIMNLSNPKVAIFFLAFLPQFADPTRGNVGLQVFALGGLFMLTAMLVFFGIAWGAAQIGHWLRQSVQAQRILNRVAGTVFAALALRLVLSERTVP